MKTVKHDHAKPPAGGHRFPQGNTVLRADTVPDLLTRIAEYRAENSLPLDFPEESLADYYEQTAPHLVKDIDAERPPKDAVQVLSEAIMLLWKDHPPMTTNAPLIELRLAKCAECPYQRPCPKTGNDPYSRKANQRAVLLSRKRDYQQAGQCSWCHLPVALASMVDKPLAWEVLRDPPEVCWIKGL